LSDLKNLIKIPDFRRLWLAQAISFFGDSLTLFGLLFLVQRLTGNAASVAGILIAMSLPMLVVGLGAGVWVDRLNRKQVMIWSDILRALLVPLFLIVRSVDQVWMLYIVAFLVASVSSFFSPARMALIPKVVGMDKLMAANSISESSRVLFGVLGTAAAGILVGLFDGFVVVFTVDALTFVFSAVLVGRLTISGATEAPGDTVQAQSALTEFRAGMRVIRRSRLLLGMLVGASITFLGLGAVNALLVPFVVGELALKETWFGLFEASQSTSMILAGALTAVAAAKLKPTTIVPIGLAVVGVVVGMFAGVTSVWHLGALLFILGWFVTPLQASVSTILQTETPPEMLGRTGSALNAAFTASNVAAMAIAGGAAAIVGVRTVFLAAGVIIVLSALVTGVVFRGASSSTSMAAAEPHPELT
jgi:DHA3 family macrolide efflux protein-like MFS transporter